MSTSTAKKARPWEAGAKPGKAPAPKPATADHIPGMHSSTAEKPPFMVKRGGVAAPITPGDLPAPAGSNLAPMVDEYATIDAHVKALEKRKKELGDKIKELGAGEYNGTKCKAVVTVTPTTRLDTAAIKAAFNEATIAKFSSTDDVVKVSIKALV